MILNLQKFEYSKEAAINFNTISVLSVSEDMNPNITV